LGGGSGLGPRQRRGSSSDQHWMRRRGDGEALRGGAGDEGAQKGRMGDGTAVVADAFKGGVEKREVGEGALAERCHAAERGYTGGVTRTRIKEGRAPVAFAPRQRMKWWPARARV
jgi:hypothetical protein